MKKYKTLILLLFLGVSFLTTSCDDDNDYVSDNVEQTSTSKISKPTFAKDITTTTTDYVSMKCRFTNGGDTWDNMGCTVHWRSYNSKPSKTPKASDMSKHESMRIYATTKSSTTFDKTHSGFSGGTYVYYYFECSNSKYTTKSNITFCVVKR